MANKKTEFNILKKIWDEKLKESGFKDIEYKSGSIASGVPSSLRGATSNLRAKVESTEEYYRMTYHFLNDHKFESELEKVIWEYYTNGLSYRSISKILRTAGVSSFHKEEVMAVINKLEKLMKARYLSV